MKTEVFKQLSESEKRQSLKAFEKAKKSGRRCGSDKNSLELVHREFFGRFTPGARFFLYYYE